MSPETGASAGGDPPVRDAVLLQELVDLFYLELRKLARRERFRIGAGATLCTTALVSEAWLKLQKVPAWHSHQHFLGTAAMAMRQVLVNDAMSRGAAKRDAGAAVLPLNEALDAPDPADEEILLVNDAVERLGKLSPRLARVVECRYFAGFSDDETATALGVTSRTVRRDWSKARAWLFAELSETGAARVPRSPE